jgi:metacaspase-1
MCTFIKNLFKMCFNSQHQIHTHLSTNYIFSNNPNKFAITIGINYIDDDFNSNDLFGCINDLNNINEFLLEKCGFASSQIISLCNSEATKQNIINAILSMIEFSNNNPDAELWFSFSGHGSQKKSFIESDDGNELIFPDDYKTNGFLSENWLHSNLCNKLNNSSKLFVLMDCCHSDSNLDLQYSYIDNKIVSVGTPLTNKSNIIKISQGFVPNSQSRPKVISDRPKVISDRPKVISDRCKDSQISIDYFNTQNSEHQGALTNAFLNTNNHSIRFCSKLNHIQNYLYNSNFKQIPLLSVSKSNLIHWILYDTRIELII